MLLRITSTTPPATDLGYLLHKHPGRVHRFTQAFGEALVFYPEADAARCTAAMLLHVDPISLVRGRRLRARGLSAKRSLAIKEFALGIEALERFVRREPLRRVHECVLGVLGLECEATDPRL